MQSNAKQSHAEPFFARFLEGHDKTGVKAGGCGVSITLKFPSDFEDDGRGS